jgi:hypothetical protein
VALETARSRLLKDGRKHGQEPLRRKLSRIFTTRPARPRHFVTTEEEAEESHQETLYDQACWLLESMTGATRQRLFAQIRETYGR